MLTCRELSSSSPKFARARGGNVAMMWALMGAVLVGLIGITVDFTRAQMIRSQMQNAVDGAALAAARSEAQTPAQREAAARAFFETEMGDIASGATLVVAELPNRQVHVSATMPMPVSLARIVNDDDWILGVSSEAERSGVNIEVAMVLDVTGSMSGSRISALRTAASDLVNTVVRDVQTPYYSKVALVPYSMGVNVGALASSARGAIPAAKTVTGAVWANGAAHNITGITRANPAVVTSTAHGFSNGDTVYISGVSGMTQVNNRVFTVANATANTFRLQSVNSSGYGSYTSGGTVRECLNATCSAVITASSHGFNVGDRVYFTGVGGMTQLNNTLFTVSATTGNTFTLSGSQGGYSAFTSGGNAWCTVDGCEYNAFTSVANSTQVFRISGNCVSERVSAQVYTDAAPSSALVGRNYPASSNTCPSAAIMSLTTDRAALNGRISSLAAAGSTAGHIGLAWGWYALSPNWGYLYPAASRGAAYGAPETQKIIVLMTDGAFNTGYCRGVISADSTSSANADRINCNATNGAPFAQARQLCTAIKQRGVIIYTVGFGLASETQEARDFMTSCATNQDHAYMAENSADLIAAFNAIAASITQLRITH
jgi:Flp pilus assembly protein TadG